MKRVMIIGGAGSGKSTLAKKLGEITGLPVVYGDQIHWKANWELRDFDERDRMFNAAAEKPEWIIDGNNSATYKFHAERADTIIFLDVSKYVRLWRILVRTLRTYGRERVDMTPGCAERLDLAFLRFVWAYDKGGRIKAQVLVKNVRPNQQAIVLKNLQEVRQWLTKVESGCRA